MFTVQKDTEDKWYKNDLGEIITNDNIDSFMPQLDDDNFNCILKKLQDEQILVNANQKSWQDYFSTLENNQKWQIDFVQNTDLQKASLDNVKKGYEDGKQVILEHNKALEQQTLGAIASKLAFSALATVGNILASVLISLVVTEVIKFFDNIIHKAEYAREALEETTSELEDLNSELETTKDRIKELEGKSSLTIVEQEELDRLKLYNKELEKRQKYLEMENGLNRKNESVKLFL